MDSVVNSSSAPSRRETVTQAMDLKTILVIGTFDTKRDELDYIEQVIENEGGKVITLDVSVVGEAGRRVDFDKHAIAVAARTSTEELARAGDENAAMEAMARGASKVAKDLVSRGLVHGMIALGGTMGTDLALDVAMALPLGLPKYVVSTVAFSPIIPPERLAADIQMILWAGGLHGLNAICKTALSQAAGAILGASRAAVALDDSRPLIGVTSLGNACLRYMSKLKPALNARGYEVAFFHSTGMGGRAFENLAAQGALTVAMDLCIQEFNNAIYGSMVSSGPHRLIGAGQAGVPQIVAPGAGDLLDLCSWQEMPAQFRGRQTHVHNKLITSLTLSSSERRHVAREMARRLGMAKGPVHLILPLGGIDEWDRPGGPCHAPRDLAEFFAELRETVPSSVPVTELSAHINDPEFVDAVLKIFDTWVDEGQVAPSRYRALDLGAASA